MNPKLFGDVAQSIVQMLNWSPESLFKPIVSEPRAGFYTYHEATLCFEVATGALHKLGVVTACDERRSCYKLDVEVSEVKSHVMARALSDLPSFDEVLSAFVGVANLHGLIDPEENAVFAPHANVVEVMKVLVAAGYAESADGVFSWTQKSRSAMRLQHLWRRRDDEPITPVLQ